MSVLENGDFREKFSALAIAPDLGSVIRTKTTHHRLISDIRKPLFIILYRNLNASMCLYLREFT
ncbi:MAG: hypothetical protein AAF298_02180 [Cyanobacteria bacterium P01_A01_bin.40]